MKFKYTLLLVAILLASSVSAQKYLTKENPHISTNWNENTFSSEKSFVENIKEAPQFSILAQVLKDDALRNALENEEMVTIFATTDEGFNKLPKKMRDSVLGNPKLLAAVIKFQAVPGRLDSYALMDAVKKNDGTAQLSTLEGEKLSIKELNGNLVLFDASNHSATIIASDFYHKNGFFHIIDGLVFPKESK